MTHWRVPLVCFSCQAEDGIRDLVRSRGLGDVYKRQLPTLRVLTSGPLPPNAAELVGSQRMHELLLRLQALSLIHI